MFSSFARSIRSIAKGPRAVLAETIAKVLSEHFVLDPKNIESSLLKDARIVLKNTQLRARNYRSDNLPNTVVSISGSVHEVVFSWKWSFGGAANGGGGMVQDVVLTIRGIKVRINLDDWDALEEQEQALVESLALQEEENLQTTTPSDGASLREKETFLQKYVRQIVDSLTLKFEDFEFTLQAGKGPLVAISGNDLELGTLSSASATTGTIDSARNILSQKISIRSFFVDVRNNDSGQSFPLIEPFGYAASIIRFSGERFKGGILSGLEIIGLPQEPDDMENDEGIRFHIGLPQIQALSSLGVMLVPSKLGATNQEDTNGETMSHETQEAGEASTFRLPLPALTIVLPSTGRDDLPTRITLPRATVLYTADGRVFQIEGKEGIRDNGASLVALANGGKWSIDFVKKIVNLDRDGGGCKMALSNETVKRILSSVTLISSTNPVADMKEALDVRADTVAENDSQSGGETSEIWTIATGGLNLQLTGGVNHWIETNLSHSLLQYSLTTKSVTSANIGKCTVTSSFDDASGIAIPPLTLRSGTLHVSETIDASVSSTATALQMKEFLFSFLEPFHAYATTQATQPSDKHIDLPFALEVDMLRFLILDSNTSITLNKIRGKEASISCQSICYTAGDMKVESKSIRMDNLKSNLSAKLGLISFLVIPGVFNLNEPIVDTSISYTGKGICVDVNKIHGTVQRPKPSPTSNSTTAYNINIPLPVHADVKLLMLREAGKSVLYGMKPLSVSAHQNGSIISLESHKEVKIRLQQSRELATDASVGKFALQLQDVNGSIQVKQFSLSSASLGPCASACGELHVVVPSLSMESGKKLAFQNGFEVKIDSARVFEKLRPLFDEIVGSQEGGSFETIPFPVEIPEIQISASQPPSTMQVGSVSASGKNVWCEKVNASVQNSISFSVKGMDIDLLARSLTILRVESMQIPNLVALSGPLTHLNLKLVKGILYVNIPTAVHAKMISKSTGIGSSQVAPSEQQKVINIPFDINMKVSKVNLKTFRKDDQQCIQMEEIRLEIKRTMIPSQDILSGTVKKGAQISLGVQNIFHDMFQIQKLETSLVLELLDFETIHQFRLKLHSPRVEAGYSTNDWSSLFQEAGSNDVVSAKAMKMPFAQVARTSLFISYQGSVVESNTTISIPEFTGNSLATSDDLSAHFTTNVLKRIPGLLTNVNILGKNVVDGSFASVGRLAMGAGSVTTAGVGSVVGTAAADGVKAAIAAGKSSRNVSTDDSYKFGDLTRGVISGLKHATKRGAQSRGSDGSDYVPGDFTVGAAQSLGEYGGRNSKKLASAGASGAAATVGLAVAGPLGFVVGGYLGGKLVGSENSEQQKAEQQQQQLQTIAPNPPDQSQTQDFNRVLKQEHQRRTQQSSPMVNTQMHHDQGMQMENTRSAVDNRRLEGSQFRTNSSQQYPFENQNQYHQPRQSPSRSLHNHDNQVNQYQMQVPHNRNAQSQYLPYGQQQQQETSSYKFGDITRGIVAKGKQADGRSQDSGYKFGDFTRGLFR